MYYLALQNAKRTSLAVWLNQKFAISEICPIRNLPNQTFGDQEFCQIGNLPNQYPNLFFEGENNLVSRVFVRTKTPKDPDPLTIDVYDKPP